jgi:hypothetical protein
VYESAVNASAAALACELIAEGRDQMVVSVVSQGSAALKVIHGAACPVSGASAEGITEYDGRELLARCPAGVSGAGATCHLFREEAGNATAADAGRRTDQPRSCCFSRLPMRPPLRPVLRARRGRVAFAHRRPQFCRHEADIWNSRGEH